MLGLKLRQDFRGSRLRGTAIALSNESRTGATQVSAAEFLEITPADSGDRRTWSGNVAFNVGTIPCINE